MVEEKTLVVRPGALKITEVGSLIQFNQGCVHKLSRIQEISGFYVACWKAIGVSHMAVTG